MERRTPSSPNEDSSKDAATHRPKDIDRDTDADAMDANPPRTTTGPITSPKFGSAGSGGAELEPGPKRN